MIPVTYYRLASSTNFIHYLYSNFFPELHENTLNGFYKFSIMKIVFYYNRKFGEYVKIILEKFRK